jgi:hypothetical protein
MANSQNDDRDRIGNRSTPPGNKQGNQPGTGGPGSTDPVNQDRQMNRDQKMGQGSSGSPQSREIGRGSGDSEE